MNALSKLQALMFGFLLLMLGVFFFQVLLLIPALALFVLQFQLAKTELKKDYPEDWRKYVALIMVYELLVLMVFYASASLAPDLTNLSSVFNLFVIILVVVLLVLVLKNFIGRRSCYGNVIFSTHGWAGVSVKTDLFSKVKEANYAVEAALRVKKGDRVKVRTGGGIGKAIPLEIVEVVK